MSGTPNITAGTVARYFVFFVLLLCLVLPTQATVCPTTTLTNIFAIATCTIGDATFSFTSPQTYYPGPVTTEWYPGLFVGDSGLGPSADSVTFTPDPDPNSPGFTLTGNFFASGGFSCQFYASCGNGYYFDQQLGNFDVSGPNQFMSVTAAISGEQSVNGEGWSGAAAWLGPADAYIAADGTAVISDTENIFASNTLTGWNLGLRQYNYSSNPQSIIGYTDATFHFNEQLAPVPAPEPSSFLLLAAGLIGLSKLRKNNF